MSYSAFKGPAKQMPINSTALANIITLVDDINPRWLLTGAGEMWEGQAQESGPVTAEFAESRLLLDYLREKDHRIEELAREIGELRRELAYARNPSGNTTGETRRQIG